MSFLFVGNEEPVIVGGIGVDRNSPLKHIQNIPLFKAQVGDYQFIAKSQHERMPGYLKNFVDYIIFCNEKAINKGIYYLELTILFDPLDEIYNYDKTLIKKQKEKKRVDLLNYILSKFSLLFTKPKDCRIIKYEYIESDQLKITYLLSHGETDKFFDEAFRNIPVNIIINHKNIHYNYNINYKHYVKDVFNFIYWLPPVEN